jgi:hypothetical protein
MEPHDARITLAGRDVTRIAFSMDGLCGTERLELLDEDVMREHRNLADRSQVRGLRRPSRADIVIATA